MDLILHGGDITTPEVLDQLNEIAPTIAVCGNNRRDRMFDPPLPKKCLVQIGDNVQIAMWHGMQTNWHRLTDAILGRSGFLDFVSARMMKRSQAALPETDIILFGHLHWPTIHDNGNQLFINPGRAFSRSDSSCAVMQIANGIVRIKIHPLATQISFELMTKDWHVFDLRGRNTKTIP